MRRLLSLIVTVAFLSTVFWLAQAYLSRDGLDQLPFGLPAATAQRRVVTTEPPAVAGAAPAPNTPAPVAGNTTPSPAAATRAAPARAVAEPVPVADAAEL